MNIVLSKRLKTIASCLHGRVVADVGCDAANLAIWLAQNRGFFVYACDLRAGPLEKAKVNLKKFNVKDRVKLIQSDGLEKVPTCIDEVVIAGLGGLAIEKIILSCSWLNKLKIPIVVQPQSFCIRLKIQLALHGFHVQKVVFGVDKGKAYEVIIFKCCSRCKSLSLEQVLSRSFNRSCGDKLAYLNLQIERCIRILKFLDKAKSSDKVKRKQLYYESKLKILNKFLSNVGNFS